MEKKISDHNYDKYIATQECNKSASENFAAILAQVNLASKLDVLDPLLTTLVTLNCGILQESHDKVLKIHILQTLSLHQI